jgi:PAS domain S-box-containing protein
MISNSQSQFRPEVTFALAGIAAAAVFVAPLAGLSPLLGVPLLTVCFYRVARALGHREDRLVVPYMETVAESAGEKLRARNAELEREVAEGRRVEEDLRRAQDDLSTAQRLAHIGSWRWSYVNDELIEGSDEYCRIHGVAQNEIHELLAHQMERSVHPEDTGLVERIFEEHETDETNYELEYRIVRPNGDVRHVREIGEVAKYDASGNEWVGTVQDITEAKELENALRAQSESLKLISRIALAANDAQSLEQALQVGLDEVCEYAGWSVGHVYTLDEREPGELVSTTLWRVDDAGKYSAFCAASEQARFTLGTELPGRVMQSSQPVWSTDIASELSAERARLAADAGLQSCFAFPVRVGLNVVAVLEFFSERKDERDEQIKAVISQIGTQLGRVVERDGSVAALKRAKGELEARVRQRTFELRDANQALTDEIAERKRAEDEARAHEMQLKVACKLAGVGAAYWNEVDDRYEGISEIYASNYGYQREEFLAEFSDGDDYRLLHPDDVERYRAWEESIRARLMESEFRFRAIRKDGAVREIREISVPILDDAGRHIQTRITQQDITDIHNMEDQLRQAQKMEAVGQLTGGIAHDFNNLLAVILANLEMVASGSGDPDETREWAENAIEATDRGASLTQRLLAFSRKQNLRPEAVNPRTLIESMTEMLRRTLGETIDIQVAADSDQWLVKADPSQLENALLNLAINARDAMPAGGKLAIETSNVQFDDDFASADAKIAPGQYVRVSVSDAGTGMPPEVADHVFEPFFTTKDVGEGSGLGLSMVYGFVMQSGGEIQVYSEPGLGTTIKIYLPRYRGVEKQVEERGSLEEIPKANNKTALVVEDDEGLRKLIVRMLTSLHYEVHAADSAQAALELLESPADFDVLLTDVVLPGGMSGCDLGKEVARLGSNIPVVYMSGYAESAARDHGGIDQHSQFLQKPFRVVQLARAVQSALEQHGAEA